MIIPPRCFTCGTVIGNKWKPFVEAVLDDKNKSKELMKAMQKSRYGFEIAEEDLKIRGPGDFMGTRQSGIPVLKIANLIRDIKILDLARKEAFSLVDSDPHLEDPENQALKNAVQRLLGKHLPLMDII